MPVALRPIVLDRKPQCNEAATHRRQYETMVAAIAGAALLLLAMLWRRMGQGFDFSDEGLYLIWIARPWTYDTSFSQFGYIYWPLYELLGGSVSGLRRANLLITGVLTAAPLWVLIRSAQRTIGPWVAAAIVLALSCAVLTTYHQWTPTPSYNSLNLNGLLLAVLGLTLIATAEHGQRATLGAILLGFGGWLTWSAKPTTSIVLALVATLFIVAVATNRWRVLAIAVGTAVLMCVTMLLILDGGSISRHLARYRRALDFANLLGGGHSLHAMIAHSGVAWSAFERQAFWVIAGLSAVVTWGTLGRSASARWFGLGTIGLGVLVSVTLAASTALVPVRWSKMQAIWMGAPALGLVAAILARRWHTILAPRNRPRLAFALALLPLPAAFGFGSSNYVWVRAADAYVIWVIAAVGLASVLTDEDGLIRSLATTGAVVVALGSVMIAIGFEQPYRQPAPLRLQLNATPVGPRGVVLELDGASASYIETLRDAAYRSGFVTQTPVIDLTGRHPGSVFALGGDAPGTAWLISGYPGSPALAKANLDRVPCAILTASWLVVTPDGKMNLPDKLLIPYGLDPAVGYEEVVRVVSPTGFGTHALLKPVRAGPVALAACKAAREARQ